MSATDTLDEHVGPELRDRLWQPSIRQIGIDPDQAKGAATFYDPHGNHVETVEGTVAEVADKAAQYVRNMLSDGYPCSVIVEPETDPEQRGR